jgi:predicted site-specific integrase-resolvase
MLAKEALKLLRVTRTTLCLYKKHGKIRATQLNAKRLDYNDEDVYRMAGITPNRSGVIYARVSTPKQKKNLENQIATLQQYANANGYIVEDIYQDIGSGLNFDRGDFQKLVQNVIQYKIKTVYITDKDRFSRISFNMWKELFRYFHCEIIVLNDVTQRTESEEKEIFSDIISMLHCFAMKMYSKRRKNKLKLIEENLEIEQEILEQKSENTEETENGEKIDSVE